MKKAFKQLIFLLILVIAAGIGFLYSGFYDVAATAPHSFLFKEAVEVLVDHSVARRAADVKAPAGFEQMDIEPGFEHYDHMCVGCHGAPGVKPMDLTRGMNPEPPDLAKTVKDLSPAEIYWIIVHGLKMTGMPGILEVAGERDRWQIAAFVHRLPQLTAEKYRTMRAAAEGHPHHHEEPHQE